MNFKHTSFPNLVMDTIKVVTPEKVSALHEPKFSGNEQSYLNDCLESTYVSTVGDYVNKFEKALADFTKSEYVISTVNGTSALYVSLLIAGIKPDDEVLVPTLTFIATANAVSYCNAHPHFVDSDRKTLGIDLVKLREYLHKISFSKQVQHVLA